MAEVCRNSTSGARSLKRLESRVEIWHVRHGERADEVEDSERSCWRSTPAFREGRYYDPPLTRNGHRQAMTAGLFLRALSFNQNATRAEDGFDRVYTSPLLRAVQTAVCISHQLGLPVQVVPGLCACTAALVRIGYNNVHLMSDNDIRDAFPGMRLLPREPGCPTSFDAACQWLSTRPRSRILAVGHREGTKRMARRKVLTPHCCIARFISRKDRLFALEELLTCDGEVIRLRKKSLHAGRTNVEHLARSDTTHAKELRATPSNAEVESCLRRYRPQESLSAGHMSLTFLSGDRWLRFSFSNNRWTGMPRVRKGIGRDERCAAKSSPTTVTPKLGSGRCSLLIAKGEADKESSSDGKLSSSKDDKRFSQLSDGIAKPLSRSSLPHAVNTGPKAIAPAGQNTRCRVNISELTCQPRPDYSSIASKAIGVSIKNGAQMFLGLPVSIIRRPDGVLSYLDAKALLTVHASCRLMANISSSQELWEPLYLLFSGNNKILGVSDNRSPDTTSERRNDRRSKVCFIQAVEKQLEKVMRRNARELAQWQRRRGPLYGLLVSAELLSFDVEISCNGTRYKHNVATEAARPARKERIRRRCQTKIRRNGGHRVGFCFAFEVEIPTAMTLKDFASLRVSIGITFPVDVSVIMMDRSILKSARKVGTAEHANVTLYIFAPSEAGKEVSDPTEVPASRACVLVGVLGDLEHQSSDECGVGFISVFIPYLLALDVVTGVVMRPLRNQRRSRNALEHDTADARHGLEGYSMLVMLHAASSPLWRAERTHVDGVLARSLPEMDGKGLSRVADTAKFVVRLNFEGYLRGAPDMDCPNLIGKNDMRLPYITCGGLVGAAENVLLMEFLLYDKYGDALWSFVEPVLFQDYPGSIVDSVVNMELSGRAGERMYGCVEHRGIGKVSLGVVLMEGMDHEKPNWQVFSTCAELNLEFVNSWFGTAHCDPK